MMSPIKRWVGRNLGLALMCLVASSGCGPRALPLGPAGVVTTVGGASVIFYQWKGGPAVMIFSDVQGGHSSAGGGTAGSLYKEQGFESSPDGRRFEWQMETTDGRNIQFRLDGKEYDLSKGTLFLVKTKGGKTEVEQLSRDLSAVSPDANGCKDFAQKDPAVSQFLGAGAN